MRGAGKRMSGKEFFKKRTICVTVLVSVDIAQDSWFCPGLPTLECLQDEFLCHVHLFCTSRSPKTKDIDHGWVLAKNDKYGQAGSQTRCSHVIITSQHL
jgi:hypothetical protein